MDVVILEEAPEIPDRRVRIERLRFANHDVGHGQAAKAGRWRPWSGRLGHDRELWPGPASELFIGSSLEKRRWPPAPNWVISVPTSTVTAVILARRGAATMAFNRSHGPGQVHS